MAERAYPGVMSNWANSPVVCGDEEWISQREAAKMLHISQLRLVMRIVMGHVVPAHNSKRAAGVTRESIEKDAAWLSTASWPKRALRLLKGFLLGF